MEKLLSPLLNELEPTDVLIELNKHYQKLDRLFDLYLEIEEILESMDHKLVPEPEDQLFQFAYRKRKRFDVEKELKHVKETWSQLAASHALTSRKSQEIFFFQKIGRAIYLHKQIKK